VTSASGSPLPLSVVVDRVEHLWPGSGAEEWDATGLVVGHADDPVSHIRLVVDVVPETVREAIEAGANLIIAHHPLLLKPVNSVAESHYKGRVLTALIRSHVGLITAHTNADVVPTGTSQVLADAIGLIDRQVIWPSEMPGHGIGQVGSLPAQTTLYALASKLGDILPQTAGGIRVSGNPDTPITTVAVCAGAGDSLLHHPAVTAADAYITSDLRHHPASEIQAQRVGGSAPALIDISHFAAEWLWLATAREQLAEVFPDLDVTVSDLVTDPWDFVIHPG
jgi:dinuclear metal center YbgI/SA1388 family protein